MKWLMKAPPKLLWWFLLGYWSPALLILALIVGLALLDPIFAPDEVVGWE